MGVNANQADLGLLGIGPLKPVGGVAEDKVDLHKLDSRQTQKLIRRLTFCIDSYIPKRENRLHRGWSSEADKGSTSWNTRTSRLLTLEDTQPRWVPKWRPANKKALSKKNPKLATHVPKSQRFKSQRLQDANATKSQTLAFYKSQRFSATKVLVVFCRRLSGFG